MSSSSKESTPTLLPASVEERAARRIRPMKLGDHPEWRRFSDSIRRLNRACVELDASPESMGALADRAIALAEEVEATAPGKPYELVETDWSGSGLMNYLPFSPIMGRLNPSSYGLELHQEGEEAIGEVTLSGTEEGAVGLAHGGVVSGIWDEVLAAANAIAKTGGPTGRLTIHYKKPTPLFVPLRFRAWVERIEERKVLVKGECTVGERVLTTAEGLFIRIRTPGIDWHRPEKDDEVPSK